MKKVSIIIPMYNAGRYIEECVLSCVKQSYERIEIIVVDDGSTDNSVDVVENLLKRHKNIQLIKQVNMGGSSARNTGIDHASGEYIYFLDADDIIFPNTISILVRAIEENESDIAIGAFQMIDKGGKNIGIKAAFVEDKALFADASIGLLFSVYPNPSTKLFRKNIIEKNSIRFDKLRLAQDLNFFFKYIICSRTACYINKPIYKYRVMGNTISTTYDDRILDILKSFNNVADFAKNRHYPLSDINNVKIAHLYAQIVKTRLMSNSGARKRVFRKLICAYKNTTIDKKALTFKKIKTYIFRLKILSLFGWFFTSNIFYKISLLRKGRQKD